MRLFESKSYSLRIVFSKRYTTWGFSSRGEGSKSFWIKMGRIVIAFIDQEFRDRNAGTYFTCGFCNEKKKVKQSEEMQVFENKFSCGCHTKLLTTKK